MITREELYESVWAKPIVRVCKQFGVSGSYMARVCTMLRVPRPERGYWAKLAVGKAPAPTPLGDPQPGDPLGWSPGGGSVPRASVPFASPHTQKRRRVPKVSGIHPLIRGAKEHFESGRKVDEHDYLRPYKKRLVDIIASKAGLDKALSFANDLFNTLESAGHRVTFPANGAHRGEIDRYEQTRKQPGYPTLWSPWVATAVYVGTLPIALSVVELSESVVMRYVNGKYIRDSDYVPRRASRRYVDHTWTITKDVPCGRLRLIAHSPDWRVKWSLSWQETKNQPLTSRLRSIVRALEDAAPGLVEEVNAARKRAEEEHQEWLAARERERQEEDRRKTRQSVVDSLADLRQIIQAWADVTNLERFFEGVAERAARLPETERKQLLERLRLARETAGTQDPLEFFLTWKAPLDLYRPLALRQDESPETEDDETSISGL